MKMYFAFDFFDTVVHRKCNPETILKMWAKEMCIFLRFACSPKQLYYLRKKCEKREKKRLQIEDFSYINLVRSIYDELENIDSVKTSFEEFYSYSHKVEIQIELENIYVDEVIKNEIMILSKQNKVIIISDFYFDKSLFESILTKLGLLEYIYRIYISSECGLRKSSGNLYKFVLDDLGIEKTQLKMKGDNYLSDFEIPFSIGIQAEYYENHNQIQQLNKKQMGKSINKLFYSQYKEKPFNSYIAEINLFISNLFEDVVKDNVQTLLFCSREGQMIKKLFDVYQSQFQYQFINTQYFYVSRKSTLIASLDNIEQENFNIIFRQSDRLPLKVFLDNLGFSRIQIEEILNECNLSISCDVSYNNIKEIKNELKKSKLFCQIFDNNRLQQKRLFKQYLFSFIKGSNRVDLVDVGWKGTIQDNIQSILGKDYIVSGYYLGAYLHGEYKNTVVQNKKGLLFYDYPQKSKYFSVFSRKYIYYEKIFAADHGPVLKYTLQNDIVSPIFYNQKEDLLLYNYVKSYQKEMIICYQKYLEILKHKIDFQNLNDNIALYFSLKRQILYSPQIWKIERNLRYLTRENFGNCGGYKKKKNYLKIFISAIKDWGGIDFTYQLLDYMHLRWLYPIASIYTKIIWGIEKIRFGLLAGIDYE